MGALCLLNTISSPSSAPRHELLYVEARLGGTPIQAMVDSGATHNFLAQEEAARLGLAVVREQTCMKAVNSEAQPIIGTT